MADHDIERAADLREGVPQVTASIDLTMGGTFAQLPSDQEDEEPDDE